MNKQVLIRPVQPADRQAWENLRQLLWPSSPGRHAAAIKKFFAGTLREPLAVFLALNDQNEAVGFIELSIRPYADGCQTDRVAYIEGWYVEERMRKQGIGGALVKAAEDWGRSQGCTEMASDTQVENAASAATHRALGFMETNRIVCFKKSLSGNHG